MAQLTSVIHCDLEGKIIYMNKGAEEIFQYRREEMVGKERVSVFSPGLVVLEHVPRWLKRSISEGHFETDTAFIRKDGTEFAAHTRITPIVKKGVHTGYIGLTTPLPLSSSAEVTPHISLATKITTWLYITRGPFLTASLVPVLLGALLAQWLVPVIALDLKLLLLTLLGVSLAHLGANTANDFFDWKSGVDNLNEDYVVPFSGGSRMIQLGVISPQGMLWTSLLLFVMAAIVGSYIATVSGIWPQVAVLGLAGGAIGILYTAPPVKLAARGLGELVIALAFGPLLVAGATLVQTGTIEIGALFAGIPVGLLTAAIVWVNEFPDVRGDALGGKRTLVVRLGLDKAKWGYALLLIISYVFLVGLVFMETLPKQALVGLISLPLAYYLTRQLFRNYQSRDIKKAMAGTIYLHLVVGVLIILGVWAAI